MLTGTCTETVQHCDAHLAPMRCNIIRTVMHQNGATSQTFETSDLAPVGVQHHSPHLAPLRCKVSCTFLVQHRKTEPTYVGTDNRSRHALRARRPSSPTEPDGPLTTNQTSRRRNQLTARAETGAGRDAR